MVMVLLAVSKSVPETEETVRSRLVCPVSTVYVHVAVVDAVTVKVQVPVVSRVTVTDEVAVTGSLKVRIIGMSSPLPYVPFALVEVIFVIVGAVRSMTIALFAPRFVVGVKFVMLLFAASLMMPEVEATVRSRLEVSVPLTVYVQVAVVDAVTVVVQVPVVSRVTVIAPVEVTISLKVMVSGMTAPNP